METATAKLNTYRQSPRKVRLLADLVRGKEVGQAVSALKFVGKRASGPMIKLIESAVANAKSKGLKTDNLIVDRVTVNGGAILYRSMPMSRGRAFRIRKRTSHVFVSLAERVPKVEKVKNDTAEKSEVKVAKAKKAKVESEVKKPEGKK